MLIERVEAGVPVLLPAEVTSMPAQVEAEAGAKAVCEVVEVEVEVAVVAEMQRCLLG